MPSPWPTTPPPDTSLPLPSVKPGNQPRRSIAVAIVLAAELRAQQPFFGMYAGKERRDQKRRQHYADARPKSESPPERIDEQPQIAGVADDTIDAARDQFMAGLDRDHELVTSGVYRVIRHPSYLGLLVNS